MPSLAVNLLSDCMSRESDTCGVMQDMDMVRHDREMVEAILAKIPIPNGFDNHPGNLGSAEVERAGGRFSEKPVHDEKSMARRGRFRKPTI